MGKRLSVPVCPDKPLKYNVEYSAEELHKLAKLLELLDGEVRIVMEHTGTCYLPVATILSETGVFVSAVCAKIIHELCIRKFDRQKNTTKRKRRLCILRVAFFYADYTRVVSKFIEANYSMGTERKEKRLHLTRSVAVFSYKVSRCNFSKNVQK